MARPGRSLSEEGHKWAPEFSRPSHFSKANPFHPWELQARVSGDMCSQAGHSTAWAQLLLCTHSLKQQRDLGPCGGVWQARGGLGRLVSVSQCWGPGFVVRVFCFLLARSDARSSTSPSRSRAEQQAPIYPQALGRTTSRFRPPVCPAVACLAQCHSGCPFLTFCRSTSELKKWISCCWSSANF